MENKQIINMPHSDNPKEEHHERLGNDSILEVIVTVVLLIIVIFIFVKFEFF